MRVLFLFHGGQPHNWHDLVRAWSFEPLVVISLAITALLFAIGLFRLKRRSIRTWEALCFALGWLALFVALVSPMHAWGRVLFSAHMTQHEILMLVAAPLLVLGRPLIVFLWALPLNWSRNLGNVAKISAINRVWRTITIPIPVGQRPWGIALTPDGRKLYTANGLSNDVTVIDTSTNKVIGTVKAGDGPWGIAI